MRGCELSSEFPSVAQSAQLVFKQVNIQAQRFGRADRHVLPVVRVESRSGDRDVVGACGQRCQRVATLRGTGGFVNHFCAPVGGLNLSVCDCLTVGVDYGACDGASALWVRGCRAEGQQGAPSDS